VFKKGKGAFPFIAKQTLFLFSSGFRHYLKKNKNKNKKRENTPVCVRDWGESEA
jgi:hypothetical protein